MIDDVFVLLLNLVADLNDRVHHSAPAIRHVLSQILKLFLERRDIVLDVGRKGGELVADCADELLGQVATEDACAHILTAPAATLRILNVLNWHATLANAYRF
jgi:hypothetical protein